MESTNTDEINVPVVPTALSVVSFAIFVLMSVVLVIAGAVAYAWADQFFTCGQYDNFSNSCGWYPGLSDFIDLEFQIWTAMVTVIFALNIVVWTFRGLLWAITRH